MTFVSNMSNTSKTVSLDLQTPGIWLNKGNAVDFFMLPKRLMNLHLITASIFSPNLLHGMNSFVCFAWDVNEFQKIINKRFVLFCSWSSRLAWYTTTQSRSSFIWMQVAYRPKSRRSFTKGLFFTSNSWAILPFITSIWKSQLILAIWLALSDVIYSRIARFLV